jgi:hypothetical protein
VGGGFEPERVDDERCAGERMTMTMGSGSTRWMRWGAATLAIGLCLLGAGSVRAAVVRALDLAQLTERSRHIVIAVAESEQARWDKPHVHIVTDVTLKVEQSLKGGSAPGARLVATRLGGQLEQLALTVPGAESFELGARALVFLYETETSHELRVVGMAQGVLAIETRDGAAQVIPSAGGAELVQDGPDGALAPAPGALDSAQPLDAVVREIRRLVARVGGK